MRQWRRTLRQRIVVTATEVRLIGLGGWGVGSLGHWPNDYKILNNHRNQALGLFHSYQRLIFCGRLAALWY